MACGLQMIIETVSQVHNKLHAATFPVTNIECTQITFTTLLVNKNFVKRQRHIVLWIICETLSLTSTTSLYIFRQ